MPPIADGLASDGAAEDLELDSAPAAPEMDRESEGNNNVDSDPDVEDSSAVPDHDLDVAIEEWFPPRGLTTSRFQAHGLFKTPKPNEVLTGCVLFKTV